MDIEKGSYTHLTASCKYCDKKYSVYTHGILPDKLEWDLLMRTRALAHCIKHHRKELVFRKQLKEAWRIIIAVLLVIPWALLCILYWIPFPVYWLLSKLYRY